jgi:hypothetical protein
VGDTPASTVCELRIEEVGAGVSVGFEFQRVRVRNPDVLICRKLVISAIAFPV